ncbi:MAG TPA: BrnT family toxin [Povalibacter sp.]|nr:BrnT family toxin [Povalibacter sp.]
MFEWDAFNEAEVAKHGLAPSEVEEAFDAPFMLRRDAELVGNEERTAFVAETLAGRVITVVYTLRGPRIRVVTAYPTRGRLRRQYLEGRSS